MDYTSVKARAVPCGRVFEMKGAICMKLHENGVFLVNGQLCGAAPAGVTKEQARSAPSPTAS